MNGLATLLIAVGLLAGSLANGVENGSIIKLDPLMIQGKQKIYPMNRYDEVLSLFRDDIAKYRNLNTEQDRFNFTAATLFAFQIERCQALQLEECPLYWQGAPRGSLAIFGSDAWATDGHVIDSFVKAGAITRGQGQYQYKLHSVAILRLDKSGKVMEVLNVYVPSRKEDPQSELQVSIKTGRSSSRGKVVLPIKPPIEITDYAIMTADPAKARAQIAGIVVSDVRAAKSAHLIIDGEGNVEAHKIEIFQEFPEFGLAPQGFIGVIGLSNSSPDRMLQPGDSGMPLVDDQNRFLGLIIMGQPVIGGKVIAIAFDPRKLFGQ